MACELGEAVGRTPRVAGLPVAAPVAPRVDRADLETAPAAWTEAQALLAPTIRLDLERRHDRAENDPWAELRGQELLIEAERTEPGLDCRMRQREQVVWCACGSSL